MYEAEQSQFDNCDESHFNFYNARPSQLKPTHPHGRLRKKKFKLLLNSSVIYEKLNWV